MVILRQGSEHSVVIHAMGTKQLSKNQLVSRSSYPMTQILDYLVRIVRFRCKDVVGNTKDGVLWIQYFRIETDAKQLFISKLRN
jgi:hypothetical protein